MIIGSFNIRGLGGRIKKRKVRDFISSNHLDCVLIQETKLSVVSEALCHYLWGNSFCNFSFTPAIGNSGGILSIWCSSKGNATFSFSGPGYVGVCIEWGVLRHQCFIVNVYSKCSLAEKRVMWDKLLECKSSLQGDLWCVAGDFNSVLHDSERRGNPLGGGNLSGSEIRLFSAFVDRMGLFDFPLLGRNFTWCQPNGVASSRLDRFLLSDGWSNLWGEATQWALPRDVSDHSPVVLRYSDQSWGPKPFRFNNFWLAHRQIEEVVNLSWSRPRPAEWMAFRLTAKLKTLKMDLKEWHARTYGKLDDRIGALVDSIKILDLKAETIMLTPYEIDVRFKGFHDLWDLLRAKETQLLQQSRTRWLREGDVNSGFFHASIKMRRRKNSILALKVGDNWVESVHGIRAEVVDFFKGHFSDSEVDRPTLDGVPFSSVLEVESAALTAPFGDEEIREVVSNSDGSKCPGPDGFNFAFYKRFWDLLKGEIGMMFDQFYHTATLPRGFSSYFVTLIPKVHSPSSLGDFRPISLLGSLYKMVAKVLASRLAPIMDKLISSNQSAFIKGRQLVDGVVAVNEIIDFARKARKDCLIFKVDFEKAYDSVSWSFLDYMMRRLGFSVRWRRWIHACVCCGKLSVLVNGCPTEEINIQKGLKQGDPLAPFLFLLVVEGLSGLVRSAEALGLYQGFKVGNSGLSISHLQYADDTLFLGEATMNNLWSLKTILRCFELASGLKVNFSKSSVMGVNVGDEFLGLAEHFLYCRVGCVPFTYLGLPVGANPRVDKTWQPLLQLLSNRLGSWGISMLVSVVGLSSLTLFSMRFQFFICLL